ncbi:MAG: hypothetical protein J5829_10460, partial [Lachnospiraceae bacterium]|nr:hypothetical protein [Lachnospiraceae bacterium]
IYTQSSNDLLKKADYTGKEVEPAIDVKVKVGSSYETVPKEAYTVSYLNNVSRGKATIIITGDSKKAFGTKTGAFTIGVRKFEDILKLIFFR